MPRVVYLPLQAALQSGYLLGMVLLGIFAPEGVVVWAEAALWLGAVLLWHATSRARIAVSGWPGLHFAPYVSLLSGLGALGLASRYANVENAPIWAWLTYPLALCALAWPAATLAACKGSSHAP